MDSQSNGDWVMVEGTGTTTSNTHIEHSGNREAVHATPPRDDPYSSNTSEGQQNGSTHSSRASDSGDEPYRRPTIVIPQDQITDFMWDWSSRTNNISPPGNRRPHKKHPEYYGGESQGYSISQLLVTNACACLMGAMLMWVYIKRCSISSFLRL